MARSKGAKRQRVSISPNQQVAVEPKHQRFTDWATQQGVEINGVLPQSLSGRGLGLVTTRRIAKGERVLFVPEEAMFKPDFTSLRHRGLERVSAQAKLAISALLSFGPNDSPLRVWLDTWPTLRDFKSCMPMYWSRKLTRDLPSSAQSSLERQETDYERDWKACQVVAVATGFTEDDFRYHWMVVNSRSFHWAPPKGGAGYMIMCPFIDYLNHGPSGTGCDVFQRSDGYEVLAQREYDRGEELLISYGAHVNEKLLVHYGFILRYAAEAPSIDDEVRIDDQIVPLLSATIQRQLSDLGYLGPFALVPSVDDQRKTCGWEPCFKTQVAIRATMLTCNEWEFFAGSGDDLSGDKTEAVNQELRKALFPLSKLAKQKMDGSYDKCADGMQLEDHVAASSMLKSRWKQIESAVQWFMDDHEADT